MARWPDERKANLIALALVFALFPLLCWLSWRWMTAP
jgi:TRAP-type C4-dicarboxylate transport system permease small subunit